MSGLTLFDYQMMVLLQSLRRRNTRDRPTAYQLKTIFQKLAKPTEKRIIAPSHVVRIRRDLNDSAIPHTSLKMKSQEIHVDWKQLYTLYFRETRNHDRLVEQWVSFLDSTGSLRAMCTDDLVGRRNWRRLG